MKRNKCGLSDEFVISNAIKINNALKSLGAPFYLVCTNANKKKNSQETWRRVGTCTIPGWENSYYSNEQNVVKYLKKNFGVSLSDLKKNPDKYIEKYANIPTEVDVQEIKEEIKPVENVIVNEIKEAIAEVKNNKPTMKKIDKKAKEVKKEVEKQLKKTDLPAEAKEIIPEIIEKETKEAIIEAIEEKQTPTEIKVEAENIVDVAVENAANEILPVEVAPTIDLEQAERDRRADAAAPAIDAFLNLVKSKLSN